jgi:hypothetical protein
MKFVSSKIHLIIWCGILLLISYGILYLNLYEINYPYLLKTFWPLILIITGILQTLNSRFRDLTSAILLIIIGVIILSKNLQIFSMELFWEKWPNPIRDFLFSLTFNISSTLFSL